MDKYEYPMCECCNSELEFLEEHTIDITQRINKNGRLSKKKVKGILSSSGINFLKCTNWECGAWFDCEYDDSDRIIRGDRR